MRHDEQLYVALGWAVSHALSAAVLIGLILCLVFGWLP